MIVGALAARLGPEGGRVERMDWYDSLAKPAWTPPSSFIGTMWTVLYPIIIVTFGYVVYRVARGQAPASLLVPIAINVVSNIAFTPIQFGLRNLPLASVDILVVLVTIVWCMVAFWPYSRVATLALTPYLAWVGTASVLQLSITWVNR
jgi:benzodiazapine receptor